MGCRAGSRDGVPGEPQALVRVVCTGCDGPAGTVGLALEAVRGQCPHEQ